VPPAVTNPLSPGVYRIDVPCPLAPVFGAWRRAQKGKVHVIELENGPNDTARVSFVVFGKPGAFPFGKLGAPVRGEVVGAMPDWPDVVAFILRPLVPAEDALAAARWAAFFAAHSQQEFAELRAAVDVSRANVAIIRMQLEQVKAGTSPNPAAAVHNAAALAKQSIELLLAKAGAIPLAFPRQLVNDAIARLQALADEVAAAPGKALHAISDFAGDALGFGVPFDIGLVGVGAVLVGAYLRYTERKPSPLSSNLMLAGAGAMIVGGATASLSLAKTIERIFPVSPRSTTQ
jgi:hypothetical protein